MDNNKTLSFIFLITLLMSCGGNANNGVKDATTVAVNEKKVNAYTFPFPSIPVMLTSPEDRKAYLLQHYWDEFDFADTALVNDRKITGEAFVNSVSLMADGMTGPELINRAIDNFCSGMEQHEHSRKVFMQMVDDYLYNPNSPFYNESLYIVYLERMLESSSLDDARKSTLGFRLNLIKRNSPGSTATDFVYYMADGRMNSLLKTTVKGDGLLLVFYDPECPSCHDIMLQMTSDEALEAAVENGKLTVLAVYTEGNVDVWKNSVSSMPEGWIVGEDRQAVKDGALYDLKAMPSVYLIGKDKKVLLKDVPYEAVKQHLGISF